MAAAVRDRSRQRCANRTCSESYCSARRVIPRRSRPSRTASFSPRGRGGDAVGGPRGLSAAATWTGRGCSARRAARRRGSLATAVRGARCTPRDRRSARSSAGLDRDWGAAWPPSELGAQRLRPESWLQPSGPIPERDCTTPLGSLPARPCRVRRTSTRQQPALPGVAAGRLSPLGRSKRLLPTGFDGEEQRGPLRDG